MNSGAVEMNLSNSKIFLDILNKIRTIKIWQSFTCTHPGLLILSELAPPQAALLTLAKAQFPIDKSVRNQDEYSAARIV